MGVDLLRGAEVSGGEIFSDNSVCILADTSFVSTLSTSLALTPTLPDSFTVDATLAGLEICVDIGSACEVAQIAGSWINKNSQTKMRRDCSHEAPIVAGRVLVQGLASQCGWNWRWVQVFSRSIELKRCEFDEVIEQTVRLDTMQASTDVFAGERVISLQSLAPWSRVDEKRLLVYVGGAGERERWLDHIWQAQRAINPARDWSATMVLPETVLFETKRPRTPDGTPRAPRPSPLKNYVKASFQDSDNPPHSPHTPRGTAQAFSMPHTPNALLESRRRSYNHAAALDSERPSSKPDDKQATTKMRKLRRKERAPPRACVKFRTEKLQVALTDEQEVAVIDLTVKDLVASVQSQGKFHTSVDVSEVEIISSGIEGVDRYYIFQGVACDVGSPGGPTEGVLKVRSDPNVPCFRMQSVTSEESESRITIDLPKAFAVNVDPTTVAKFREVLQRIDHSFSNQIIVAIQHQRIVKALNTVILAEVPPSFYQQGSARTEGKKRLTFSLNAVGLQVLLLDRQYQQTACLKMMDVSFSTQGFDDGSTKIKATLGSLRILDCSAPMSLYHTIMTVSESSDAFVDLRMHMLDNLSIGPAANSLNQIQIKIERPQITLLLRFVNDLIGYLAEFQTSGLADLPTAVDDDTLKTHMHNAAGPADRGANGDISPQRIRDTAIRLDLVHPELRLPRSSCSLAQWILDFGSIVVDSCANDCSISLIDARLDTVEATLDDLGVRTSSSIITDINGSAQLKFGGKGGRATETTVDVELDALRGSLTNSQYALLMAILDSNFSERRARDVTAATSDIPLASDCTPCAHALQGESSTPQSRDMYGEILQKLKQEAAKRLASQLYSVNIHQLELALHLNVDSSDSAKQGERHMPLLLAHADGVRIQFAAFNQEAPQSLQADTEQLASALSVQLSRFEVIDTRFPSPVTKLVISSQAKQTAEQPFPVHFFVTNSGLSVLEIAPEFVELVSDIGLITSMLTWFASRNRCHCGNSFGGHTCSENGFEYVRETPPVGTFIIEAAIPSSSIHLVTQLDDPQSPGFDMNGTISSTFIVSQRQSSLHVYLPDLILKRRESEQQLAAVKSDAGIDVIIWCGIDVSCQWWQAVDIADQLTVKLSALGGQLTYEVVMLACRVSMSLLGSIDRQIDPYVDVRHAANSSVVEAPDTAHTSSESETAEARSPKPELEMSIVGNKVRLTIVDDFEARWQPLVRVRVERLDLRGTSSELDVELANGSIDYFHFPISAWKEFLEESALSLKYVNVLERGRSSDFQLHLKANSDIMMHVSREAISSFSLAAASWSKDQRSWEEADYDQRGRRHSNVFVPYAIHNMLHETLICVTEDGTEHRIESQQRIGLSYAQVWCQSSPVASRELRHSCDLIGEGLQHQIELVLEHSAAARKLGSVSIDVEERGTLALHPEHAPTCACETCTGVQPMIGYHVYGHAGQKCLRVYSMTSLRNCTSTPLRCVVFRDQEAVFESDLPANGRDVPVPLALSTSTVCVKPTIPEDLRGYEYSDLIAGSISLQQVHDGSFRETEMVDFRFQKAFGAELPPDTALLKWYTCANDVPGKGLRQGVLYITNKYLCHKSDVLGKKAVVIPLSSIIQLKKVNTALVIPNAIRVKTKTETYNFRTLHARGETFREILKVLPNKDVVSEDDDTEATAKAVFGLKDSDAILACYPGKWHHDPGESVYTPRAGFYKPRMPGFTDGKIFFTSQHLLFMANGDDGMLFNSNKAKSRHKVAWADVKGIEKRKSMLVRNNAVLISTAASMLDPSESLFLSSGDWDRDKAVDKMSKLCSSSDSSVAASGVEIAAGAADDDTMAATATGCRQLTCLRSNHPLSQLGSSAGPRAFTSQRKTKLADMLADADEYKLHLSRSRDALSFNVMLVDAVTAGTFSNRKTGNPSVIELHAPWIVENLTCLHLELQLIDKIRSVIATVILLPGDSCFVTAVDQRRNLRARARQLAGNIAGPWSNLAKIYTKAIRRGDDPIDLQLEVPDVSEQGGSQSVEVEVNLYSVCVCVCVCLCVRERERGRERELLRASISAHMMTTRGRLCKQVKTDIAGSFRLLLYNKFWLLNLTGIPLESQGGHVGWDRPRQLVRKSQLLIHPAHVVLS